MLSFLTRLGLHALRGHLEGAELKVEVEDCLDVDKALGGVGHPGFSMKLQAMEKSPLWEAFVLSHEEGKGVVPIRRLPLGQEDLKGIHSHGKLIVPPCSGSRQASHRPSFGSSSGQTQTSRWSTAQAGPCRAALRQRGSHHFKIGFKNFLQDC